MPDIPSANKKLIRSKAKDFVNNLWDSSFKDSFMTYDVTLRELYKHGARWNFCLLCGEIDTVEKLTSEHDCIKSYTNKLNENHLANPKNIPMIISTSWIKLQEFFLTEKHNKTLKKYGFEKNGSEYE